MRRERPLCEAVAVGVSAGGLAALNDLIPRLPERLGAALLVVQHQDRRMDDYLARALDARCALRVVQGADKAPILSGVVYVAPPNYHMLVEDDRTIALSVDDRVRHARPSIDVLFESAAEVYGERLAAVVLTGASSDGARGLAAVQRAGGATAVQDPRCAEAPYMPEAALAACRPDCVGTLDDIAAFLVARCGERDAPPEEAASKPQATGGLPR